MARFKRLTAAEARTLTRSELMDRIRAQLDEDERIARDAAGAFPAGTGGEWRSLDGEYVAPADPLDNMAVAVGQYGWLGEEVCEHIARHDPARVLAEVQVKRWLLDEIVMELADDGENEMVQDRLRHLALPYADQPGCDEGWRP